MKIVAATLWILVTVVACMAIRASVRLHEVPLAITLCLCGFMGWMNRVWK